MIHVFSAHGWKAALVGLALLFAPAGLAGEPEFLVTSGKVLDSYWADYFATGDPQFVRSILAYEESEDLLLRRLNENAQVLVTDQRLLLLLDRLRVVPTDAGFVTEFELDTLAGILFRSPGFRDDLRALFERLPDAAALMVRAAVKSAAFWSLLANARQNEAVRSTLDDLIPSLKPSSRFLFGFFQRPAVIEGQR